MRSSSSAAYRYGSVGAYFARSRAVSRSVRKHHESASQTTPPSSATNVVRYVCLIARRANAEGFSSSLAAARLQALGFHRATDVVDGFEGWRAAGLPVEREDGVEARRA